MLRTRVINSSTCGAIVLVAWALALVSDSRGSAAAIASPVNSNEGRVRAVIWLTDQRPLAAALDRFAGLESSSGADFIAGSSGSLVGSGAKRFAQVERARNRAFRDLDRRYGDSAAASHRIVMSRLQALGARREDASFVPNTITVSIAAKMLGAVAKTAGVSRIERVAKARPLGGSVIDGSPTWVAAGCTGGGAADTSCPAIGSAPGHSDSLDGIGGPDVAVDDSTINLFHSAFDGRSPRVVTPAGRTVASGHPNPCPSSSPVGGFWCPYGSKHANTIAAILASRDTGHLGMAPGVDKLLDPVDAGGASSAWMTGFTYNGNPGATDLPELVNYSAGGNYNDDDNYGVREVDMFVSLFGIAWSVASGNNGPLDPIFNDPQTQYRVITPCIASNALCMGGIKPNGAGRSDDVVAGYSSRGPSIGGRKKPDLLAYGTDGCPSDSDATTWLGSGSCGTGTSYAAPRGGAGILLLASVGVTSPMAQRALLINTSYMVDSENDADLTPQDYWTPDAGWGELALEQTFPQRGNYALSTVTSGPGANSARFFRVNGLAAGDRTTLAWNRRVIDPIWPNSTGVAAFTTSDLDLRLLTPAGADNDADVCGLGVTTCGVDSAESSENTGPHAVPADGTDNVEQVRASSGGDAIVKVKASSAVSGASTEPFAIASAQQPVFLSTPTIDVAAPGVSPATAATGQDVTVTADFTNDSTGTDLVTGLDLQNTTATISLPAGATLAPSSNPGTQNLSTLGTGQTKTATWTVRGSTDAVNQIAVTGSGSRFGETFSTTSSASTLTVDGTAPTTALTTPGTWLDARTAPVTWAVADSGTAVSNVELQVSIDGSAFQTVYSGPSASGSTNVTADEGQSVVARIRATDSVGNSSSYRTSASWTIDADPPILQIGGLTTVTYGDVAAIAVSATNVGASTTIVSSSNSAFSGATPVANGVVLVPTLGTEGRGATVWVAAIDALGRKVIKRIDVSTTPQRSVLRITRVSSAHGVVSVKTSIDPNASGRVSVGILCSGQRASKSNHVRNGSSFVRLRVPRRGSCEIRAKFKPRAIFAFSTASASRSIRISRR